MTFLLCCKKLWSRKLHTWPAHESIFSIKLIRGKMWLLLSSSFLASHWNIDNPNPLLVCVCPVGPITMNLNWDGLGPLVVTLRGRKSLHIHGLSSKNHCNEEGRFSGCPASSYLQGCIRVPFSIWEWIWEKLRETDLNGSVHPTITSLATPSTLLLPLLFLLHLISVPQSRKCFNVIVTPISILLHRCEGSRLSIVADWALFGNHMDLTS